MERIPPVPCAAIRLGGPRRAPTRRRRRCAHGSPPASPSRPSSRVPLVMSSPAAIGSAPIGPAHAAPDAQAAKFPWNSGGAPSVPGRIVVVWRHGASNVASRALSAQLGATTTSRPASDIDVVQLPPGASEGAAIHRLERSPLVRSAEPDRIASLMALPNDTHFDQQWALEQHRPVAPDDRPGRPGHEPHLARPMPTSTGPKRGLPRPSTTRRSSRCSTPAWTSTTPTCRTACGRTPARSPGNRDRRRRQRVRRRRARLGLRRPRQEPDPEQRDRELPRHPRRGDHRGRAEQQRGHQRRLPRLPDHGAAGRLGVEPHPRPADRRLRVRDRQRRAGDQPEPRLAGLVQGGAHRDREGRPRTGSWSSSPRATPARTTTSTSTPTRGTARGRRRTRRATRCRTSCRSRRATTAITTPTSRNARATCRCGGAGSPAGVTTRSTSRRPASTSSAR